MKTRILIFLFIFSITQFSYSQCPQFYDFDGNLSSTPEWIVCDGNDFILSLQSNEDIGNYSIDWGDDSPQSSGTSWLANTPVEHTYSQAVATYTVTINLTDIPCVVLGEVTMEEPTNASIQIPFGGLTSTCAPGSLDFINSSTDVSENTTFIWDFFDGTANETYDHTNVGQLISHLYEEGSINCATQVTLTAENKCNTLQGGPSLATFTPLRIWDIDKASISANKTLLCYPDVSVSFQNTTERNCYAQGNVSQRYEYWNLGDYWGLGYDSIINWRPWPPALEVNVDYPDVGVYEVMLIDSSYCGLDTATLSINIVNPPIAGISANKDTICVGESITFYNQSTGYATSYIWNFGDGSSWTQVWNGNVTRAFYSPGDYEVLLIPQLTGGICRDTATVKIHVSDVPNANFSFDNNNGCDSMYVQINNLSSNDVIQWNWDFGNGNTDNSSSPPLQHYSSSGSCNVTLNVLNSSGCTNSLSKIINLYQTPTPNFEPTSVCVNEQSQFNDLSVSQANDTINSWTWQFGDGGTSSLKNPTHIYANSGDYDVILEVSTAHCQNKDTISVTVESIPTADFSADINSGCSPLDIVFTNNSSNNSIQFYWNFSDGNFSNLENPTHQFLNNTALDSIYSISLTVSTLAGCKDSTSKSITVLSIPIASFVNNAVLDCAPLEVNFSNTSQYAINYNWNFGDGTPLDTNTHTSHTFSNLNLLIETFDVQLIASNPNGCKDTASQNIIVYPEPQFTFSSIPASGCSPLEVNFPSVNGAVEYNWNFGDGNLSNSSTPTHTFENNSINSQNFLVSLVATSPFGCKDSSTQQISVNPNPTANFVSSEYTSCSPLNTTLTNNSTNATIYEWNIGDSTFYNTNSTFNIDINNTASYSQNYEVKLIATNNYECKDSLSQNIIVYPKVSAEFTSDTTGCNPLNVSFINNSVGASEFLWDFDNGISNSNANNQNHLYINNTSDVVTFYPSLMVESVFGCKDSIQKAIEVFPSPNASFTASEYVGCSPIYVDFTNNSTNAQEYMWDFGDGNSSDMLNTNNYEYTNLSTIDFSYSVKLIAKNQYNCLDSVNQNIVVYPQVKADFVSDSIGCSPLEIDFYNLSIGQDCFWDFGDGSISNSSNNQSHTYTNTGINQTSYLAKLNVQNDYGCSDSIHKEITVLAQPNAQFSVSENNGCHPLEITINNTSTDGDNYIFDMGDGNTINSNSMTINYNYENTTQEVQNYTISLISYINQLCTDTSKTTVSVYPKVFSNYVSDTVGCSPLDVQFYNLSIGANNSIWDFGNGQTDNADEIAHAQYTNTSSETQIFNTQLISSSEYGCADTSFRNIYVFPTPLVNFTASPSSQMLPNSTVEITNNSSSGNWAYLWDFGDNNQSDLENPSPHTYSTFGNYPIKLVMYNEFSCSDSATVWIEILPNTPIADFSIDEQGCAPLLVNFTNNSQNATSFNWDFGDGTYSNIENPNKVYHQDGIYSVSLTVFNESGSHSITRTNSIEVFKNPISQFLVNDDYIRELGVELITTNQSQFANTYHWDFGDSFTSTKNNPSHYYENNGIYTVTLIAYNDACSDTSMKNITIANNEGGHIIIPNSFTPNSNNINDGDFKTDNGVNDIFYPVILGAKSYTLDIYNRWGEHLFHTDNLLKGWNGYFKEELCQQDVYVYKIHVVFHNNTEEKLVGHLTLIR
ncbi:MAG: PKD domain-containing protein [Flavobacteriales bacterium]|nr:PKD domain-containing protein [Flavobacteriales bacterium]